MPNKTIQVFAVATAEIRREPSITIKCGHCDCVLATMSLDRFTKYGTRHEATCVSCQVVNVVGPFSTVADVRRKA